jgi:alkylation response protein AidB-like acyl-CoA dehydrogenase
MAIDFTLTPEQKDLQASTREFAQNVLAPVVREADAEPDPLRAFQLTKDPTWPGTRRASPSACCRGTMAAAGSPTWT